MCKIIIALVAIVSLVIGSIIIYIRNESSISTIENCKVIDLQQQQLIHGSGNTMSTEIRYLVITEKETFVCENSYLNGKFNNSDIYWRLKKDSTYTFKVAGIGKSIVTDYRNILEVSK